MDTNTISSKLIQYDAKEFSTSSDATDYLGCGGFGAVRRCYHERLKFVAAKCISLTGDKDKIQKNITNIQRETSIHARLIHPNIITILGCASWNNEFSIILEYADGGNLSTYIKKNKGKTSWKLRLHFSRQIASALLYLHNYEKGKVFCHGDLKPENILLTFNWVVKLSDFGAVNIIRGSRVVPTCASIDVPRTRQCTELYVSPEFYKHGVPNPASDIYSFGMVLYEIITMLPIFNGYQLPLDIMMVHVCSGLRPEQEHVNNVSTKLTGEDLSILILLKDLMIKCWDGNASNRPSANMVFQQLNEGGDDGFIAPTITSASPTIPNSKSNLAHFSAPFMTSNQLTDTGENLIEGQKKETEKTEVMSHLPPVYLSMFQYNMNHPNRGVFIIFNQEHFTMKDMEVRHGSKKDAINLEYTAKMLDFEFVRTFHNCTKEKIMTWMTAIAQADHTDYDCLVCCVLTNGDKDDVLYASDGSFKLTELTKLFRPDICRSLAGKPKLFFVQACRGNQLDNGLKPELLESETELHHDEVSDDPFKSFTARFGTKASDEHTHANLNKVDEQSNVMLRDTIPLESDFLIVHSTAPGYYSWRNMSNGSIFIQNLCDALQRWGSTMELMQILTNVNYMTAHHFESSTADVHFTGKKQIPSITSRLTAALCFTRKQKSTSTAEIVDSESEEDMSDLAKIFHERTSHDEPPPTTHDHVD